MRVVLLGHQVAYTASPAMQGAAFAAAELEGWTYEVVDVPAGDLPAAVAALRGEEYAGANVTIPHKRAVIDLLDEVEAEARELGAVNTIVRRGSRLLGSNTDVGAIRSALAEAGVDPAGARAVVLGAGGSARAAGHALMAAEVVFVARDPRRAEGLGRAVAWDDPGWHELVRRADVVVNATPLGRRGELPFPAELLNPRGALIDLVYVAGGTPLVKRASALGVRCVDGWPILIAQGAGSFRAWTGREPSLDAMAAALAGARAGVRV